MQTSFKVAGAGSRSQRATMKRRRSECRSISEASSIDNWREVVGSIERVIGPTFSNEPGLMDPLAADRI
jgi:hypothetical protein